MEGKKLAGMALAATAAALFMTGCTSMGGGGGTSAKVHCEGANACKGMERLQVGKQLLPWPE